MPILVECDVCGKKYRLPDDRAGSTIECKECFGDIDVPGQRRASSTTPRQRPTPRRKAKSGMNPLLIIGGIVGGIAVVGIVAVVALVLWVRAAAKPDPNPFPNGVAGGNGPVIPQRPRRPNFPARPPRGMQPFNNIPGRPGVPAVPGRPNFPNRPQRPKLNLIAWNVEVDPPTETFEFDGEEEIRIPMTDRFGPGNLIFPPMPTAFVLVGKNSSESDTSAVYDLRTQKKITAISGLKLDFRLSRLSQDGKFLVGKLSSENSLLVYDVAAGKILGKIPFGDQFPFMQTLELPGSKRIVATGASKPITIWGLPAGTVERTIEPPKFYDAKSLSFSPGGRYMTVIHDSRKIMRVYDITNGQAVGELAMPVNKFNSAESCECLVFSPDGKELAGLFGVVKSKLLVWDVSTGRQVVEHQFDASLKSTIKGAYSYRAKPLEWFPDRSRWLVYGYAIVDRKAGGPVWSAPVDPVGTLTRRVIDNDRVVTAAGPRGSRVVASLKLPHDEINQATALVQGGGTAGDLGLPPLTKPSTAVPKAINTNAVAGKWQVKPDPAPQLQEGLLAKPMPLKLSLKPGGSRFQQMLLSRAGTRFVVCQTQLLKSGRPANSTRPRTGGEKPKMQKLLTVFNVATGGKLKEISLAFNCTLIAVSQEGTRCLVRTAGRNTMSRIAGPDLGRIDLYSTEDGSHIAGWRPYKAEEKRNREVDFALFIDDTHVLTRSNQNKVVLWEIPSCKPIYTFKSRSNPVLTAGGKYLVDSMTGGNDMRFYDPLTGQLRGTLQTGAFGGSIAFHPDGERIATIYGSIVKLWSMNDGQLKKEFRVAGGSGSLQWCGDRYLLAGNRLLIDIEKGLVVWTYLVEIGGTSFNESPDTRHWFVAPKSIADRTALLAAATIPHPEAVAKLSTADLKAETILAPGGKVSLNVNFGTPAGMSNITDKFKKSVTDAFRRNNITVAAGQPVVVTATLSKRSTGKTLEFEVSESTRFGLPKNKKQVSVPATVVEINIKVTYRGALQGREFKKSISNNIQIFISQDIPEGKTVDQFLTDNQWGHASRQVLAYRPPTVIFTKKARSGFGISRLSATGITPLSLPK